MIAPESPLTLPIVAALLVVFALVASTDGLYFHLYRYRLHRRPASRVEHRLHTAAALLFPLLTYLLICRRSQGGWLWLALLLFLATVLLEFADVFSEKQSRADLGGLFPTEYAMHFLMSGLRFGSSVPLFLADTAAYRLSATALSARPPWFAALGWTILLPGVVVGILHVALDPFWLTPARLPQPSGQRSHPHTSFP